MSNYINAFSIKTIFIVKKKTYIVEQCVIGYIYTLYVHLTVMPPGDYDICAFILTLIMGHIYKTKIWGIYSVYSAPQNWYAHVSGPIVRGCIVCITYNTCMIMPLTFLNIKKI